MKTIKQHILERLVISKEYERKIKNYKFNDLTSLLKKYDEKYHKPFNLEETLAKVTGKRLDQIPDGNLKETLKSVSANYAQFQFDKNFYETSKKGSQVGMLSEDFAKNLYKNQGNNDAGKLEFKEDSVDTGKVKVDLPKELLATEIKTTGEDGKKEKGGH